MFGRVNKMNTRYFPLFVDISGMKILVVGGGHVAARRIRTLLAFARDITVIAPEIHPDLQLLIREKKLRLHQECYTPSALEGADLVLAATDRREVNEAVVRDCREREKKEHRRILVNTADHQAACDFYFPSVILEDEVIVALNSGGRDPGKVKQMRQDLEAYLANS